VQDEAGDPVAKARGVLQRHRGAQADASHIVLAEPQSVDKGPKKLRMAAHGEGRLAGRRLTTSRQVGDQHSAVSGKGRPPGVEVLERADEAVT